MSKKINRRGFIKKAILGIISLEIGYLIFDTFKNKSTNSASSDLFSVGKLGKFENNTVYPFTDGKFQLSVLPDGGMLALSVKCTHLGCIVQPSSKGFTCPCHASSFDKHGEVLSPPANRALDIFPISVNNGEIMVDINNPIRRKSFDKSQITYI